jgi:PAS domain-containing protein
MGMSDSVPRPRKTPLPDAGQPPASGEGSWELDLLSGTASFSDWFYQRLQWPAEVKRRRLADLKPSLPAGAWEALLLAIRAHLERQTPLDLPLRVQLPGGEIQFWRVLGSAVRNEREKPVLLTGNARDITAEAQRENPDGAT